MQTETTPETEHRLLWLDLETTGLAPHTDEILELEMRITDLQAENTLSSLHFVIQPLEWSSTRIAPEARAMHSRNNLLKEVADSDWLTTEVCTILFGELLAASDAKLHPAGSSPQFDLDFLTVHLPEITSLVSHQRLDLSSIRRYLSTANPEALADIMDGVPETNHRTSRCLGRDIEQYRRMLAWAAARA